MKFCFKYVLFVLKQTKCYKKYPRKWGFFMKKGKKALTTC